MSARIDITGQRFGRLIALNNASRSAQGMIWLCLCDCGNKTSVHAKYLKAGNTKSCGCWDREAVRRRNYKHGYRTREKSHPLYNTWQNIHRRCSNKRAPDYKNYGGRGITVCEQWQDFERFLSDMGERPAGCSIDRIDNDQGYFPSNCRWATHSQQMKNRRAFKRRKTTSM